MNAATWQRSWRGQASMASKATALETVRPRLSHAPPTLQASHHTQIQALLVIYHLSRPAGDPLGHPLTAMSGLDNSVIIIIAFTIITFISTINTITTINVITTITIMNTITTAITDISTKSPISTPPPNQDHHPHNWNDNHTCPQPPPSNHFCFQNPCLPATFPIPVSGLCLAHYVSGFDTSVVDHNLDGSNQYGIFQLNSAWWCDNGVTPTKNLCHIDCHGKAAMVIPWSPTWPYMQMAKLSKP